MQLARSRFLLAAFALTTAAFLVMPMAAHAARAATPRERSTIAATVVDRLRATPGCTANPASCRTVRVSGIRVSTVNPRYSRAYGVVPSVLDPAFMILRRPASGFGWQVVAGPNTLSVCGDVPDGICRDLGGTPDDEFPA